VCVRSHFGSRYRHRFSFVGTNVFRFLPDSAVLVLTFTAASLISLVHSVYQAPVIHVPTSVGSSYRCLADLAHS
jgi:hypothetical protein